MMEKTMPTYPLLFKFAEAIVGAEFTAVVKMSGRALMTFEDDEWVMYGVVPGSATGSGNNPQTAYVSFKDTLKKILADTAHARKDYESFKAEVERFSLAENHEFAIVWEDARNAVKTGKLNPEKPFADLQRITEEAKPNVTVECLSKSEKTPTLTEPVTAADNDLAQAA
jgi:hypothetical protein